MGLVKKTIYSRSNRRVPQKVIRRELLFSSDTATDWANYCRQVVFDEVFEDWSYRPIGGPGIEVEIDESKFSRLKYGRGEAEKSKDWVFGGVERFNTENCFMLVVPRRDAKILIPLIQKWILPGSIIYSDCWKAYNSLR